MQHLRVMQYTNSVTVLAILFFSSYSEKEREKERERERERVNKSEKTHISAERETEDEWESKRVRGLTLALGSLLHLPFPWDLASVSNCKRRVKSLEESSTESRQKVNVQWTWLDLANSLSH